MFPPPRPWKQVAEIDPDREYVAFTSRFFLKSALQLPRWLAQGPAIMKQVDAAPGIVGWSLGANLPTLEFFTLSAWEDADRLRTFAKTGAHGAVEERFARVMRRPSIFVQYTVLGRDLPLRWDDAIARQNARS